MKNFTIDGPAGSLEAMLQTPQDPQPGAPVAVLAHPHPQMGGSMHDAVLTTLAEALLQHGITCLRFNFRGAGNSAGSYDEGDGELEDMRAALNWLARNTDGPLWSAGYSFGSWVAWRLHTDPTAPALERLILVAPLPGRLDHPDRSDTSARVQLVAGTADTYLDLQAISTWADRNAVEPVREIAGADHFFRNHGEELRTALDELITSSTT